MPSPPSEISASNGGRLVGVEARRRRRHLDAEAVGRELVRDVDVTVAVRAVRMAHGVRDGLGQRELQVGDGVVVDRTHLREPREGEPAERDVLGLRRARAA